MVTTVQVNSAELRQKLTKTMKVKCGDHDALFCSNSALEWQQKIKMHLFDLLLPAVKQIPVILLKSENQSSSSAVSSVCGVQVQNFCSSTACQTLWYDIRDFLPFPWGSTASRRPFVLVRIVMVVI